MALDFYELTHFFRLNEEHFNFHLQYKHSGTFANRKYEELSNPQKSENVRPHYSLDCLQSTVSLKIRLVFDLIQRDCKPLYRDRDETKKVGLLFFLLGLTPSFLAASGFADRVLRFYV